jgi:hypothetical protein
LAEIAMSSGTGLTATLDDTSISGLYGEFPGWVVVGYAGEIPAVPSGLTIEPIGSLSADPMLKVSDRSGSNVQSWSLIELEKAYRNAFSNR